MDYLSIRKEDVPDCFSINDCGKRTSLKVGKSREIYIKFPLTLDKDLAKICAMILDGSLNKNLSGVMFSQKKDLQKAEEFSEILSKTFEVKSIHRWKEGTKIVSKSNKTLAYFLYHCLDIHKSDENAKVPRWIWDSPQDVIIEYLRYAFAMEGSVADPKVGNKEIRFHSCDKVFMKDLQLLLKQKFNINFRLTKYFIKNYGWKYYLVINSAKEIFKFSKIGFSLESHQKRLEETLNYCKSKAWKITLVEILKIKKGGFSLKDVHHFFPYLKSKRTIYERLSSLIERGYLERKNNLCFLTKKGEKKALEIKPFVNISTLRTKPKENERTILNFISKNDKCWRNEIARETQISFRTIKDVLIRLEKKGKIKYVGQDKFHKKFYEINKNAEIAGVLRKDPRGQISLDLNQRRPAIKDNS